MMTATVQKEHLEAEKTGLQETAKDVADTVSDRLFSAAKEVTDEIEECGKIIMDAENECKAAIEKAKNERDIIVEKAESRREELKIQFRNALTKMQNEFGISPNTATRVVKSGKASSVKSLILKFLEEKQNEVRTADIRHYLQTKGKKTNPGVELSRLVKDGQIINKERGMYSLPHRK
jgi:hypothetical protein